MVDSLETAAVRYNERLVSRLHCRGIYRLHDTDDTLYIYIDVNPHASSRLQCMYAV